MTVSSDWSLKNYRIDWQKVKTVEEAQLVIEAVAPVIKMAYVPTGEVARVRHLLIEVP